MDRPRRRIARRVVHSDEPARGASLRAEGGSSTQGRVLASPRVIATSIGLARASGAHGVEEAPARAPELAASVSTDCRYGSTGLIPRACGRARADADLASTVFDGRLRVGADRAVCPPVRAIAACAGKDHALSIEVTRAIAFGDEAAERARRQHADFAGASISRVLDASIVVCLGGIAAGAKCCRDEKNRGGEGRSAHVELKFRRFVCVCEVRFLLPPLAATRAITDQGASASTLSFSSRSSHGFAYGSRGTTVIG